MSKKEVERSGVARCQRCFKYGHLTYECQNEPAYRYRPSRTMQYKEKMMLQIKASTKAPETKVLNPDYKRRVIDDGPSSDSEEVVQNEQKTVENTKKEANISENDKGKQEVQEESDSDSSSDSSSSESSSDSSSDSSDSDSDSESESQIRKKKPE